MRLEDINETILLRLDPTVAKAIVVAQSHTDMITKLAFALIVVTIWFIIAQAFKNI